MLEKLRRKFRKSFFGKLWDASQENDITTKAAGLALFSSMSVFPLIALIVWASTLDGNPGSAHVWVDRVEMFVPPDFADLIRTEVDIRLERHISGSALAVTFHLLLLLFSAAGAIRSFLFSLRDIAQAEESIGIHQIVLRSVLFIIPVILFVFIASMLVGVVSFFSIAISNWLGSSWLKMPLIWLIMTAILVGALNGAYASSLIGHQTVKIHGWTGALAGASMISLITISISLYNHLNPANRDWYGTPGFIITVLLWFYACAVCILLGAQINAVRHQR